MSASIPPRPRGRPVQSDRQIEDMKARIAGHALSLFQQDGYHAISMRRLAQEAGCTVMTIYRYYERKIDILRALWSGIFETLFVELDHIADRYPDPVERLEAVAIAYVHFWLEHREHYFLVFMSSGVDHADVSIFVQDDALVGRFLIFQRGIVEASGETLADDDLRLRSELLMCALNGISHNLITIGAYPWSSPDALVRAAVTNAIGAKA